MRKVRVYDNANLKRDHIISVSREVALIPEVQSKEKNKASDGSVGYEEACRRYSNYISAHGKRLTPERAFILKKIYEQKAPVDIQTLYDMVCKEEGQVALSTIYNNLALLIDAQLVRRIDLVNGAMAFFEKTLGVEPHGYVVCQRCGKIKTLQISKVKEIMGEQLPKSFMVTDFNLQVNGLCKKCQTAARKEAEADRKTAIRQRKATAKAAVLARKANKKMKKKKN